MKEATNTEANPESFGEKIIRDYIAKVESFLCSPYTFELPPNDKKLTPDDPSYYRYMCRINVLQDPMLSIENILADSQVDLDETSRSLLQRAHDILWSFTRGHGRSKNRTAGQMAFIRETIESVVKTLKDFLHAHGAGKK